MELSLFKPDNEPEKFYWIIQFPHHYTFVIYETEKDAEMFFRKRCELEGTGLLRKADPDSKEDVLLVREEIVNVRLDRQAGVPNLPFYPGKGWL